MTEDEIGYRDYLIKKKGEATVRDLNIDAFADGVLAHRVGLEFHENPHGDAPTLSRLSWALGWNERALKPAVRPAPKDEPHEAA